MRVVGVFSIYQSWGKTCVFGAIVVGLLLTCKSLDFEHYVKL